MTPWRTSSSTSSLALPVGLLIKNLVGFINLLGPRLARWGLTTARLEEAEPTCRKEFGVHRRLQQHGSAEINNRSSHVPFAGHNPEVRLKPDWVIRDRIMLMGQVHAELSKLTMPSNALY